jgi:hypothetical protein
MSIAEQLLLILTESAMIQTYNLGNMMTLKIIGAVLCQVLGFISLALNEPWA